MVALTCRLFAGSFSSFPKARKPNRSGRRGGGTVSELKMLRVIVVDDEPVIASSVAMILRISGFVAEFFTNPNDALKSARIDPPDLLVSDVIMPQMSGIELAIAAKEICSECKVLLFSGQAATADLLLAARSRGYEFQLLDKPVHPTDLLAAIRALNAAGERRALV